MEKVRNLEKINIGVTGQLCLANSPSPLSSPPGYPRGAWVGEGRVRGYVQAEEKAREVPKVEF